MMDLNTAAAAAAADVEAPPVPAAPEPEEKHSCAYEKHRPAMAALLTKAMTRRMTEKEMKDIRREAIKTFRAEATEDVSELNLNYLARDTMRRLQEDGVLGDHPRAGAPPKLSSEKRRRALHVFLRGNGKAEEEFVGFPSLAAGLDECEELRTIQEEADITPRTLWRALKAEYHEQYGCKLTRISIIFRPKLKKTVKKERLAKAQEWAQWDLEKFRRIVWIDEKQEYLRKGGTYRCYAPFGMKSFLRESKAPLGKCPKLKYEAAVAGFCGPVFFKAITGTTGAQFGYKVRTVPPRAHFDPASAK